MKIPSKNRGGDCFEAAGHYMMDNGKGNPDLFLVHGVVEGQGAILGLRYSHAFCEVGGIVIDNSNGRHITLPKELYYRLGNVGKTYRYDYEDFIGWVSKTKHWGPWQSLGVSL